MPRLSVPAYRFHKARNCACVGLPVIKNGKKTTHTVYLGEFDTPASRDWYNEVIADWMRSGGRTVPASAYRRLIVEDPAQRFLSCAQIAADFVRERRRDYTTAPGKFREDDSIRPTMRLLRDTFRHLDARKVTAIDFERLQRVMIDHKKWSIATIRRRRPFVREAFFLAAKKGLIDVSIESHFRIAKPVRFNTPGVRAPKERLPVDPAVVEQTLPHLRPMIRSMVIILMRTGMRPSELFKMRWIDIKRTGPVEGVWTYQPETHKTSHLGKQRPIHLGPVAQEELQKYLTPRVDEYIFTPAKAEAERLALLHAERKTPLNQGNRPGSNRKNEPTRVAANQWTGNAFAHSLREAQKHAGVPRWTAYQLRHLFSTQVRDQFDLEAAAAALGHSSPQLTDAIYARRKYKAAATAALALG